MYYPFLFFICWFICLFPASLNAQAFVFSPVQGLPAEYPGQALSAPWAGGLNSPQFSAIDINGDGLSDIFVFDRESGSRLLYINVSDSNGMRYQLSFQALSGFPELQNWVLLRDFDGDGRPDIFTWVSEGVQCYRNTSSGSSISFQAYGPPLRSKYGLFPANLFVSLADLPDMYDVDGDGDLDLLTMNILGGCVEWHRNLSRELYGHSDSLIFELATGSWGRFREYGTLGSIQLQDSCAGAAGTEEQRTRHAGTTLLISDISGNGLADVVIGDADTPELAYLQNGGTQSQATMISLQTDFPATHSGTLPVFIPEFPGSFLVPVGLEPAPALIFAPNAFSNYEDREGVWLYNRTAVQPPQFQFRSSNFLQGDMIDVGTGAVPVLANLSNAAIPDLIVGSFSDFSAKPRLWHFAPRLSGGNWRYELLSSDLAGTSALPGEGRYPTFGDLNGDGLNDLVFSRADGRFFWVPNTGTPVIPEFLPENRIELTIQAGAEPMPLLYDVDRDGLPDLIIGRVSGTLSWHRNSGTPQQPQFSSTPTQSDWGGVNVSTSLAPQGKARPAIAGPAEQPVLYVGNAEGRIFQFTDIYSAPGVSSAQFTQLSNQRPALIRGSDVVPALYDFDGDGLPIMLLGNRSGGVFWLKASAATVSVPSVPKELLRFYPNPSLGRVCVTEQEGAVESWRVTSLTGKVQVFGSIGNCLDLKSLSAGLYSVCVQVSGEWRCEKVAINGVGE